MSRIDVISMADDIIRVEGGGGGGGGGGKDQELIQRLAKKLLME